MHIKKAPLREQWSLDGSFAVLLDGLVPWQDVVEVLGMPLDVSIRQVLEEVLEVLERVQAVGLGSLDDAVDGGAGFGSFRGVTEQPIRVADGEVADGALGKPFVDSKELVDPLDGFFADAAEEVFFRQIWRNGLDEVPPCMCLAEGMCVAGYFLVAG